MSLLHQVGVSKYLSTYLHPDSPRRVHRDEDAPGGIGCILCPSIWLGNFTTYLVLYHLHNFFTLLMYKI